MYFVYCLTCPLWFAIAALAGRPLLMVMARMRLLTFNIAHARGPTPVHQSLRSGKALRANLLKIARLIDRLAPDIVALQEIDENSRWSGSFDHLAFLQEHCSLKHSAHGVHNRRAGRYHLNYGNAVLSRWPIHHREIVSFGRGSLGEKGFLYAEIDTAAGRLPLINLHLHHRSRPQRLKQVVRLMRFLEEQHHHRSAHWRVPPLVCGDFNTPANRPDATATLLGYFEQTNNYTLLPKAGRTFPALMPVRALDFVFLPEECREARAEIVRSLLSDHRPVLVEFTLA
jgi:endonuclease/exonuclease/phosphatase family metal-dependent hydrolase